MVESALTNEHERASMNPDEETSLVGLVNQLREQEEELRLTLEATGVGIWKLDIASGQLFLNPRYYTMLGYEPGDFPATLKSWEELLHPEDVEKALLMASEFLQGSSDGAFYENEFRMRTKHGHYKWIHACGKIVKRDGQGRPSTMIGSHQDITRLVMKDAWEKASKSTQHILLINKVNEMSNTGFSLRDIIKTICDELKRIHRLHFAVIAFKQNSSLRESHIIFEYVNLHPWLLAAAEKIVGVKLEEASISLAPGSVYAEIYHDKKPVEIGDLEQLIRLILDVLPENRKILKSVAVEALRITGAGWMYLVPFAVGNEMFGHLAAIRIPRLSVEEKNAVAMVVDKVSAMIERKRAEEQIKKALAEKEVLLREVHHRVKNNLQAIIHLIEMKQERIDEERTRSFLRQLQEQARTMSLVYAQLYQSDHLARIGMATYLNNLAENIYEAFAYGRDIHIQVAADNILMDVETAMPCGLIVNELLTNAIKYAFPQGWQSGHISVNLKMENDHFVLLVCDDGIGLPAGLDWQNSHSQGLKLVRLWATHQLGGQLDVISSPGASFRITFKEQRNGVLK